jgi:hypothetical protein
LRRSSDAKKTGGACTGMQAGTLNGNVEADPQKPQQQQRLAQQQLQLLIVESDVELL